MSSFSGALDEMERDIQRTCSRIRDRADLTIKVMRLTGRMNMDEAYETWHQSDAYRSFYEQAAEFIGQLVPDGETATFKELVMRQGARAEWDKYFDKARYSVSNRIRDWRVDNPGADPLRAHALMREICDLYHQIPAGSVKLEYVQAVASELGLTLREVGVLLGASASLSSERPILPPVKGLRGGNGEQQ